MGDPSTSIASVELKCQAASFILEGDTLTDSFIQGPVVYRSLDSNLNPLPSGETLGRAFLHDDAYNWEWTGLVVEKKSDDPYRDEHPALQDTRSWFCHHGPKGSRTCNLLFADGSVRNISDRNGDRLLNPGFQITCVGLRSIWSDYDEGLASVIGYVDATVDLPPEEVFSGLFIVDPRETVMAEALRD
jgi:prepilin-type processing-associated H-X9-DG protein